VDEIILHRESRSQKIKGTVGHLSGLGIFTLELPWLENKKAISCIPVGEYLMMWGWSPRFRRNYWRIGVPGRTGILIHKGNYLKDTSGCILVGLEVVTNPDTQEYELRNSGEAYGVLIKHLSMAEFWKLRVEQSAS
jgi:hypothetical protein